MEYLLVQIRLPNNSGACYLLFGFQGIIKKH
jgi:folate-dependent tRNA-U54 methylase TrmFO/GidA